MNLVAPDYAGGSIVNLSASLLQAFGLKPPYPPCYEKLVPPELLAWAPGIVLLIYDALGLRQFETVLQSQRTPNLARLTEQAAGGLQHLTSIFPSTTSAALTSLNTARPPSEHGMLGMRQWLDELGVLGDMLRFRTVQEKPAVISEEFLRSGPTIHQRLAAHSVPSYVISSSQYKGTEFTRLLHQGAHYRSRVGDLIVLALGDRQLLYDYGQGIIIHSGGHASLSADEMLVPLIVAPHH